jgi:hypothetical protein
MFGILKNRWRILHNGFHYHDKEVPENICNLLLSSQFLINVMERNVQRCHRGGPINSNDGMWFDGLTPDNPVNSGRSLEHRFSSRRSILAQHLRVFKQCGGIE